MRVASPCVSCGGHARDTRVLHASTALDLRVLRPWARRFDAIRIEFLEKDERKRVEEALERDYLACGCGAGRVAFAVTLALLAIMIFAFYERLSAYPTELLALGGLLVLALVTLTAMLVAVVRARLRLNRTVDRLIRSRS